jgi:hypothetical protein
MADHRKLGAVLALTLLLGLASRAEPASAETEGQAVVAVAQAIQAQSYPQQPFSTASYIYCYGGGNTAGATPGINDSSSDGSYSDCSSIGRTGFDCSGLALYAVHQGTAGAVTLSSRTAQGQYSGAASYGGSYISLSSLQPGDLVFFGSSQSSSSIEHVGIVASGNGPSAEIISAESEHYGIKTDTLAVLQSYHGGGAWAVAIPGVGNPISGGHSSLAVSQGGSTVYYEASNGKLMNAYDESGWKIGTIGGSVRAGSPIIRNPNVDDANVFFIDTDNRVSNAYYNSTGWHIGTIGGRVG